VVERPPLDLVLEHRADRQPEGRHDDDAHGAEPPEQGEASGPRPHDIPFIGSHARTFRGHA
jgi:hypothetical protein